MINEVFRMILPFVTGVGLGVFFFFGLWWTVRKGISSRYPALVFLASNLLRTFVVVAGFYLVCEGQPPRLVVCLVGFTLSRPIVSRLTRPPQPCHTSAEQETSHAR